jgi:hypothetical protein
MTTTMLTSSLPAGFHRRRGGVAGRAGTVAVVTTHERELRDPVDLCDPEGIHLNPAARGWSRHPLHRANLEGEHGRNKRWDYWAVLAGDVVVSLVYSDIDHFGLADVWWADLSTGSSGGHAVLVPSDRVELPDRPGTTPLRLDHEELVLDLVDDDRGTRLAGSWHEPDGRPGALEVEVALPADHESLNVVIPWDDTTFNYTSKHQARPATGTLTIGDRTREIGTDADAWGVLDVGRGRWPSSIHWNWGGGAGRADGHVVGLQFGAKWTEGSGFTENGFLVDGRLTKIGRELTWDYDWDDPLAPWHITDPDGQLEVVLSPRYDKHTRVGDDNAGFGSETHQVFGTFAGTVRTDDGDTIAFDGLKGFAEEARQRW